MFSFIVIVTAFGTGCVHAHGYGYIVFCVLHCVLADQRKPYAIAGKHCIFIQKM